ncbi:MAG: DUF6160 family protein [Desulfosalsimonadaceae bacterium]
MKKLALILSLIIIPCSAFGLEMLNDNAMDQVTGQSGVSIAVDDVQLFINIDKMAYIDCDGFNSNNLDAGTCTGAGGAIGLNNFQIDVLNVNAIVSSTTADDQGTQTTGNVGSMPLYSTVCGMIPLFYDYGTASAQGCYLNGTNNNKGLNNFTSISPTGGFIAKSLTIDVTEALPALTAGFQNNNTGTVSNLTVGGVLIGIPTLEIYIDSMSMTPFYTGEINGRTSSTAANNNKDYGTIELQGITFTTLSGWLEIAPH